MQLDLLVPPILAVKSDQEFVFNNVVTSLSTSEPRSKQELEKWFNDKLKRRVLLTLTENRTSMISFRGNAHGVKIRMHSMFQHAPFDVLDAVAIYAAGKKLTPQKARLIDVYIEDNRERFPTKYEQRPLLQPIGETHNLKEMLQRLNSKFFEDKIVATITWSKETTKKRRRSIRLGSYSDDLRLIRIHPSLDRDFVPAYFVESVIYHEMLHEQFKIEINEAGRKCIHSKEFLSEERKFPDYERARKWEAMHIRKLLR